MPATSAVVVGLLLLVLAFALAEFITFPATGHRINTAKWPPEVQAILKENPGTPITSEQWKRIDQMLRPYGGTSHGQVPYWSQTVRASWWWFLALPAAAVALLAPTRRALSPVAVGLLTAPSVVALVVGLLLSSSSAS